MKILNSAKMSKLSNFKNFEIKDASNLKGGVFCEWYINQRTSKGKKVNSGQLSKAMALDAIVATDGVDAALATSEGQQFAAKYA
jgi:hypothetical protein